MLLKIRSIFKNSKLNNKKGMTLLEIMIVVAIIGTLVTILANQVMGRLAKAQVQEAKIQIAEIGKALDMYYTDCGSYPEKLEDLITAPSSCSNWGPEPYIKKLPKDPWNKDLVYELENGNPILISYGKNGTEGGDGVDKDISSEDL